MAFFLVDKSEVCLKALCLARGQLTVVNESRVAQNLGEEVLLNLSSQQIDLMGPPCNITSGIWWHALRPRPLLVDEAEELGLVLRESRSKHESLPEGLKILRLYDYCPVACADHKLEHVQ